MKSEQQKKYFLGKKKKERTFLHNRRCFSMFGQINWVFFTLWPHTTDPSQN
uniref:Uncharacterized protein n=1 Tax=Anguilla anguilla TaxID=7936 RepID=A0A0E9VPT5_ANGAN